ncbi:MULTISPECIES: hypothetical protein [unclassified Blastococcus]|uniref:hypothetical protein n=1 Tax=unclassified Blastococcus TaxID=2619396 RepID=UPI001EF0EB9C|nr:MULTISPECIES: hypothetical protein [unclassified Blastococcus]
MLGLAQREALAPESRTLTDGHIALGPIREGQGAGHGVLHDRGADVPALRDDLRLALDS